MDDNLLMAPGGETEPNIRFDILFVNALQNIVSRVRFNYGYELIKFAAVLALCFGYYVDKKQPDDIFNLWVFILIMSILHAFFSFVYSLLITRTSTVMSVGITTGHARPENGPYYKYAKDAVSKNYDFTADQNEQLSPETKKILQRNLTNNLKGTLLMQHSSLGRLLTYTDVALFFAIVTMIILLIPPPEDQTLMIAMISFVVIEGIRRFKYIAMVLLVALCPLGCIGLIIYACCCYQRANARAFAERLESDKYRISSNIDAQVDCAICYQSFAEGEQIVKLPCNDKHIFHTTCIKAWFQVGSSCPICRQQFNNG